MTISSIPISSFVRCVVPMNSIFAVWPFPLLEKKGNKEKHKLFLGTNAFLRYNVTTRAGSDESSYYEPAPRGNGFRLSGTGNTQQEEQETGNIK